MAVNPAVNMGLKNNNHSKEFQDLLENIHEPCSLKKPSREPPDWLDKLMFKQGLSFIWQHYFAVEFCSLLNLVIDMSIPSLSYPLLLTKQSETKEKAFLRYSRAEAIMQKLYTELPWEKSSAVQRINSAHSHALKKVQNLSKQEAKRKTMDLIESLPEETKQMESLDLVLLQNLKDIKTNELMDINFDAYFAHEESDVFFSQFDIAMGQYAFFGHLVMCPE